MKKVNRLHIILLIALTALIAVGVIVFSGGKTASADSYYDYAYNPYSYYFEDYCVTYDIASNRKISVEEQITIHFTGTESTGFMKDIPVNGGELVQNVKVYEIKNGSQISVNYDVYVDDGNFITVDIGDYSNKTGKSFTYLITYDYCLTKAQEGKDALYLNVIGLGRDCVIENASVILKLPKGFLNARCLAGTEVKFSEVDFTTENDGERTVLSLIDVYLPNYAGVTFEMNFESGALSTYIDYTPYLYLIPAFILLAVMVLLKMFVFNKNALMPVVNYEAPDKMDPLTMGKLIDNKVNNEDITSLIYYWASKGYLKINLDDKNDPVLIRITQKLPDTAPEYEKLMYYNLFKRGEMVNTSQLKNNFYTTTEQVKAMVNKRSNNLYDKKSINVAAIFMILGALLLGLAPLITVMTEISAKFLFLPAIIIIVPIIFVYLAAMSLFIQRLKMKKSTYISGWIGVVLLCAVVGLLYVIFVPSYALTTGPKIALFVVCSPLSLLSVFLISRTKEYNDKLNEIIGFKNFITLAEKDQLEMMIETDPQFYYHILPYAQVLGVTDIWEDKFKDITVQPPQWLTGNALVTCVEIAVINSLIRRSMANISSGLISRPSSSPSSSGLSGGHGGFGGGSIGGGHGGGGFRGR